MDIRDVESINTSRGFRFLGVNEERLVGVPVEDMIKTTDAYSFIRNDINVIKSDLVENKNAIADLNDKKITKFYANNLGETTLNDSDNGKIVDMKIYGKSEQKQYSGKNLLDCSGLTEQTINGVTFTPIYDNGLLQYININGTVTDTVNYLIFDDDNFTNENRFISIMEQEISGIKGHLAITEISGTLKDTLNVIFPTSYEYKKVERLLNLTLKLKVEPGTYNNVKIYPMITLDTVSDYEPYVGGIPSPNPAYPQEIKSVVNPVVKVCGKNIAQKIVYGYINQNNRVQIDNMSVSCVTYLVKDNTYTVSSKVKMNRFKIGRIEESDLESLNNAKCEVFIDNAYDSAERNFKSPFTGYAFMYINVSKNDALVSSLQVELGSTATSYQPYTEQTATLPYTLNAIPVSSGGNVTIDGQQYIADYVDIERKKLVRMIGEKNAKDLTFSLMGGNRVKASLINYLKVGNSNMPILMCNYYGACSRYAIGTDNISFGITLDSTNNTEYLVIFKDLNNSADISVWNEFVQNNDIKFMYALATPTEIDLTDEEVQAFKALATYYPTTNISVTSEQLDGYTTFNYPISMANGWNYIKEQLGDTREYIYDMDLQSAEAYVNSEYAVALAELEV